jgi:hypothetical protein
LHVLLVADGGEMRGRTSVKRRANSRQAAPPVLIVLVTTVLLLLTDLMKAILP